MDNKLNKSDLFKAAHAYAKNNEGETYRLRFAQGLKLAYELAKTPAATTWEDVAEYQKNKLGWYLIDKRQWEQDWKNGEEKQQGRDWKQFIAWYLGEEDTEEQKAYDAKNQESYNKTGKFLDEHEANFQDKF